MEELSQHKKELGGLLFELYDLFLEFDGYLNDEQKL